MFTDMSLICGEQTQTKFMILKLRESLISEHVLYSRTGYRLKA